jgi:hypothetical protein
MGEIQFPALKTDPDILSLAELGSLMTAMGNYGLEAERCANVGAHLASCTMLAATVEGQLVICVCSFPEEAERALKRLQETNQINRELKLNSVLEWDLRQLLKIAREAQWLPSQIKRFPFPSVDTSDVLSPDRIRELRNLVHPGRLVRERHGQTITKEELDLLHDTCLVFSLHLAQKFHPEAINPEMPTSGSNLSESDVSGSPAETPLSAPP